jgi:hypothetical protein
VNCIASLGCVAVKTVIASEQTSQIVLVIRAFRDKLCRCRLLIVGEDETNLLPVLEYSSRSGTMRVLKTCCNAISRSSPSGTWFNGVKYACPMQ